MTYEKVQEAAEMHEKIENESHRLMHFIRVTYTTQETKKSISRRTEYYEDIDFINRKIAFEFWNVEKIESNPPEGKDWRMIVCMRIEEIEDIARFGLLPNEETFTEGDDEYADYCCFYATELEFHGCRIDEEDYFLAIVKDRAYKLRLSALTSLSCSANEHRY